MAVRFLEAVFPLSLDLVEVGREEWVQVGKLRIAWAIDGRVDVGLGDACARGSFRHGSP